jgi:hypothetical protein
MTKPSEVTITVPSPDDPGHRECFEWIESTDAIWKSMCKMSTRKQFKMYAEARGVPVKAAISYALRDRMECVGVAHISRALSSKADAP